MKSFYINYLKAFTATIEKNNFVLWHGSIQVQVQVIPTIYTNYIHQNKIAFLRTKHKTHKCYINVHCEKYLSSSCFGWSFFFQSVVLYCTFVFPPVCDLFPCNITVVCLSCVVSLFYSQNIFLLCVATSSHREIELYFCL